MTKKEETGFSFIIIITPLDGRGLCSVGRSKREGRDDLQMQRAEDVDYCDIG